SMTGYGFGRAADEGLDVTVELRSVNNRFLDINLRLPRALYPHDPEIRESVRKRIERGRVTLVANVEYIDDQAPDIHLNRPKLMAFARQLEQLRRELKLEGGIRLEHLLTVEDVFVASDDETYRSRLWKLCRSALEEALNEIIDASTVEAEALCRDIVERIVGVEEQLGKIRVAAATQVEEYQQRLQTRLEEILSDERIDRNRIETEVALAADRLDISEEIVRLDSHLRMFSAKVNNDGPIGKTLGFILQEMSREANTIASKCWALEISQAAIRIKELLEQVREQVQNIE
ncbi:MAG TPA: YicC family protein, partial [Bacteroidetes bacterium]|nr:YicC family protein [Bacteroidota bacterium]